MKNNEKGRVLIPIALATVLLLLVPATFVSSEIDKVQNFITVGGPGDDIFYSVAATSDGGFIAVGHSSSIGYADWKDASGKYDDYDAIIMKFRANGAIEWKNHFGGRGNDSFSSVIEVSDGGFVAVGESYEDSFGTGDWKDHDGKGSYDAVIVKYDRTGKVAWKSSYGGPGIDLFNSVTATSDGGCVVAGSSPSRAIIIKYDADGKALWDNSVGGVFDSVTATSDGCFVAVGYSEAWFLGINEWNKFKARGDKDAIIAKFDASGKVVWKKNFGGPDSDRFFSVTAAPDGGCVAVGQSYYWSFGSDDWANTLAKGNSDATIVKFNAAGSVDWKKNFGGFGDECFWSVTMMPDGGFLTAGASDIRGGDWEGQKVINKLDDATLVKFYASGNIAWKKNFSIEDYSSFRSVITIADGSIITAGSTYILSPPGSDINDKTLKIYNEATITKFSATYDATEESVKKEDSTLLMWLCMGAVIGAIIVGISLVSLKRKTTR